MFSIHPSIHPSIINCLSNAGHRGLQCQQELRLPSPQTVPPAPLGEPQGVARQAECHSPSNVSWVFPGAPLPVGQARIIPPQVEVQETSETDVRATSTGSSRCGGAVLYSELLRCERAPPPFSKSLPCHPAKEAHFGRLYPTFCPFGHYPSS